MRLPLFSILIHLYLAWRLIPALWAWPAAAVAVALLLVASAWLIPKAMLRRRSVDLARGEQLAFVGMVLMGLFSSLLVLSLVRDIGLLAARAAEGSGLIATPFPALDSPTALAVVMVALVVTAWGFVNARRTARVKTVIVPIRDLPAGLEGFTIAQISDIHVGPTIKGGYVTSIVTAVNALGADLVAITGDLVDGSVADLGPHVAPLSGLVSRHGTFFVTGNHEYYSGAYAWIDEVRRLGIRVLHNEHVVLDHGMASLLLAGVTDFNGGHFDPTHRSDPQAAMLGAPAATTVRVLLAHQPRSADEAARAGFQLQLSGHTHGGQFLPWNFFVKMQQPFVHGLHRVRDMWVYISRGTGYWGPPKRFGAPSEITRLRLVNASPVGR
ncbi:MAG: serine/threonine protein phosphatase [Rhizobacter sp.]|nr:serine/threonine protein phosphatase [Rhizobacter sp.]